MSTNLYKFLKKYLQYTKGIIFHTAVALTFTAGLSYIAGLMRNRLLAQKFGAGPELDAYFAAFAIPDMILAVVVTSTISTAFIPIFTQQWQKSHAKASEYAYNILFLVMTLMSVLVIAAIIFAPMIADLLVPSYEGAQRDLYITLMQTILFAQLVFAVSNVFGGVLLSTRDFFFYGIAPVFYNLGIIAGLFFFEPTFGIHGVALGVVLGATLHMMSRAVIAIGRIGFSDGISRIRFWKSAEIRETLVLVWPKIFHIIAWQILLVWFASLAIKIQVGGNTIYNYARDFQSMPVSLIGIAIALSTFTTLSFAASQNNLVSFRKILWSKGILLIVLTTLAALALNAAAPFLISFFLKGGRFTDAAVQQVTFLLQVYVWSIPFESLVHLLARANYALKKTFIPSLINVLIIALIIFSSQYLAESYKLKAIPYSFIGGLILQCILLGSLLWFYLSRETKQKSI